MSLQQLADWLAEQQAVTVTPGKPAMAHGAAAADQAAEAGQQPVAMAVMVALAVVVEVVAALLVVLVLSVEPAVQGAPPKSSL